jgi:hypothetical protein
MMGPKRADFARAVIRTLQQNPQLAPSGLDVAGAQADLDALDRMQRIDDRVQRLATLTKDSRDALGSEHHGRGRRGLQIVQVLRARTRADGQGEGVEQPLYALA